jgi:replication factor C small subunit
MASERELLWAEKYRPRTLDEIVDQEEVVARLKRFVEERNTPHLLFAGPPGTGKCVTGDTPVLTPMGPIPIAEIVERHASGIGEEELLPAEDIVVYTLNARGEVVEARASHVYRGRARRLIRLRTRLGREAVLTAQHPLLVNRDGRVEWVPAGEIRVGDRIALPRRIRLPEKNVPEEEARRVALYALSLRAERNGNACLVHCVSREAARSTARVLGARLGGDERTIVLEKCVDEPRGMWVNAEALRIFSKTYLSCFSHVSSRGVEIAAEGRLGELLAYALLASGVVARMLGDRLVVEDKAGLRSLLSMDVYDDSRRSLLEEAAEIALEAMVPVGRLGRMLLGVLGDAEIQPLLSEEIPEEKLRETILTIAPRLQEELLRMEDLLEKSRYAEQASGTGRLVAETTSMLRESTLSLYRELSSILYTLVFLSRAEIYWDTVTEAKPVEEETTVYDLTVPETSNFVGGHGPMILHNTTAALAFAHDLYGEEYPRYLLELNASLTGETPVMARIGGVARSISLAELERIAEEESIEEISVNDSRYLRLVGVEVPSYDPVTGRISWSKASWLIRHRAPAILRIRTRSGAELGLTGNHSVMLVDGRGRIVAGKASSLRRGSLLIAAPLDKLKALVEGSDPQPGLDDPVPAEPLRRVLGAEGLTGLTATRREALRLLSRGSNGDPAAYRRISTLARSVVVADEVVEIRLYKGFNNYVYDLSVPGREVFFAGSRPILVHNSDERGIETIRTKVKEFARSRVAGPVPFKLVLLDEADNMTADAQQALRRLMELYTATTRFILIANFPSKIIEPIQSRCAFFRFTPLRKEDVIARLKWIAEQEGVEYELEGLETIYEISEGDMRRAINLLQAASALGKVTTAAVYKVVGMAHPREVREMLSLALRGEFTAARDKLRQLMIEYGLSGLDIVKQMHREIFSGEIELSEEQKVLAADYIGEIQFRLVEGGDDEIQLNALLAWLALLGTKLRAS